MPSTGFLKVQTLTSRAELPVAGAVVSVSAARAGGGRELLNVQRTDESGMTELISVPTPELSNSLSPELPRGWTDVQIAASHPDFDGVVSRDVQIFPGVTTIQTLRLVPRGGMPTDLGETEDYTTPPQDL
ncbi:MAG: spore cortex-lytic protein [Oscillospiraceae bacterium]|nr:spore cortex-lytic protein [Oscillospiraceae bacterium]MBR4192881.1 spore cortex-lytic protein [Oscillospiraceae bacterium]